MSCSFWIYATFPLQCWFPQASSSNQCSLESMFCFSREGLPNQLIALEWVCIVHQAPWRKSSVTPIRFLWGLGERFLIPPFLLTFWWFPPSLVWKVTARWGVCKIQFEFRKSLKMSFGSSYFVSFEPLDLRVKILELNNVGNRPAFIRKASKVTDSVDQFVFQPKFSTWTGLQEDT